MPKTMEELKGQRIDPKVLGRVKRARRRHWRWVKKCEERGSFNRDQYLAQELNSV